jgi:hypothetical protein
MRNAMKEYHTSWELATRLLLLQLHLASEIRCLPFPSRLMARE